MNPQDRANERRVGQRPWRLVVGGIIVLLLLVPVLPLAAEDDPATMWITRNDCGTLQQDVNHYAVGEMVYINGANFSPGSYAWTIMGQPGTASLDPGQVVASGGIAPTEQGSFCFGAYTIQRDDGGAYEVTFGVKSDGYRVDFPGVPTATNTRTVTNTPTRTSTATPRTPTTTHTPSSTATSTTTAQRTASTTPTRSWTSSPPVSTIIMTRVPTATPTRTIPRTPSPMPLVTTIPGATATPVVAGVRGQRTPTIPLPAQMPNTAAPESGWCWLWLSALLLMVVGLLVRKQRRTSAADDHPLPPTRTM